MRPYIVIKEKLNIRNRTAITDETYVGMATKGEIIWGKETLLYGDIPRNSKSKYWISDHLGRFFSYDGVQEYQTPAWISDFGISEIWKVTRGIGSKIVILDSGFSGDNLGVNINKSKSFSMINGECHDDFSDKTEKQHGSKMATIIGGNSEHYIGIAPDSEIIVVKFTDKSDKLKSSLEDYLLALNLIDKNNNGAVIILNNSLAFAGLSDEQKERMEQTISNLANNIFVVAAIGNIALNQNTYPAYITHVISCAGVQKLMSEKYDSLMNSPYWDGITVTAPGNFLDKNLGAGTSQSCAFISGILALYISYQKHLGKANFNINDIYNFINSISETVELTETISSSLKPYKIVNRELLINHFTN